MNAKASATPPNWASTPHTASDGAAQRCCRGGLDDDQVGEQRAEHRADDGGRPPRGSATLLQRARRRASPVSASRLPSVKPAVVVLERADDDGHASGRPGRPGRSRGTAAAAGPGRRRTAGPAPVPWSRRSCVSRWPWPSSSARYSPAVAVCSSVGTTGVAADLGQGVAQRRRRSCRPRPSRRRGPGGRRP